MEISNSLGKVEEIAQRYNIKIWKEEKLNFAYKCPFNSNVGIKDKSNVSLKGSCLDDICVLIHEMGHCVFDNSKNFANADEFPWLSWEYMFAVEADIAKQWDKANCNYMTENGIDWGILSNKEKIQSLKNSYSEFKEKYSDNILMNEKSVLEAIESFEWIIQ